MHAVDGGAERCLAEKCTTAVTVHHRSPGQPSASRACLRPECGSTAVIGDSVLSFDVRRPASSFFRRPSLPCAPVCVRFRVRRAGVWLSRHYCDRFIARASSGGPMWHFEFFSVFIFIRPIARCAAHFCGSPRRPRTSDPTTRIYI